MNINKLSNIHKEKLLEMCVKLFPEYRDLEVRDSMEDFCYKGFEHICVEFGRESDRLQIIHWFEFCALDIPKRISDLSNDTLFLSNLSDEFSKYARLYKFINMMAGNYHPIEYLYKEFQKLGL